MEMPNLEKLEKCPSNNYRNITSFMANHGFKNQIGPAGLTVSTNQAPIHSGKNSKLVNTD